MSYLIRRHIIIIITIILQKEKVFAIKKMCTNVFSWYEYKQYEMMCVFSP